MIDRMIDFFGCTYCTALLRVLMYVYSYFSPLKTEETKQKKERGGGGHLSSARHVLYVLYIRIYKKNNGARSRQASGLRPGGYGVSVTGT